MIAHSPQRPVVIPWFHHGIENAVPQHPVTKKVDVKLPRLGHKITVRFGSELSFDDLIEEHEAAHGPLWKYTPSIQLEHSLGSGSGKPVDYHKYWDSSPAERLLYSKITLRIQRALEDLNEECLRDLKAIEHTGRLPPV